MCLGRQESLEFFILFSTCSLPAGTEAAVKHLLSLFGLLDYSIPLLLLHVDSSSKFSHRNVYLPLKVLSARSVHSQKSYFYSRIPWAFPMATTALSLHAEPLGRRLPRQATPQVGGWARACRNANLQPLTPLCCSREQENRKQASKGKRSKVAWAGPWISCSGAEGSNAGTVWP